MLQYVWGIIGKNETTKNNNKNKCLEIGNNEVLNIEGRGGVLEDVLGLEDVFEDTFSSPWPWPRRSSSWPWPRSLKSSKIALSSARGQHYFLNSWNFAGKRQKHCTKFASIFFVFLTWSKGVAKGMGLGSAPFPIEISILKTRGSASPSIQFLPANLNV